MLALISFLFFTALVAVATYVLVRGKESESSEGFFLAGRSLTAGVIAGSLLLTNLSTEQLVGLNGDAYADGLVVMAWEVVAGLSLVVMAIFVLPRYLARGITTIPEYLAGRFDQNTRTITNGIFIAAYTGILLPIILYTGARGLTDILNLRELTGIESDSTILWIVVWLIGLIGSLYAIVGGLRTVAISDTINGLGLLVGGVMIAWLGLRLVGDGDAAYGWTTLREVHPEKFHSLGGNETSVPWHTLFTGVLLLNLFYWTTNQQIIQRTLAARSLADGQKGVLLAAFFKILAPLILVLPGIMAFHLDSSGLLYDQSEVASMAAEAETKLDQMPREARELALAGGEPSDWVNAQVNSKKKGQSYGAFVRSVLPDHFTGFFAAVMVGAILSSFNSALNATATLFSLGIYRRFINPTATDQATVRSGRWFGIVIALVAMTVAPMLAGQDSIFGYLQKMNGLYFIPILAVVAVGMFDRRAPAWSANLALVAGFVAIALGYFVFDDAIAASGLHQFHFLGIVFAALVLMMELAAFQNPNSSPDSSLDESESSPIPMERWPLAKPVGAILTISVLVIYGYFAIF